MNTIIFASAVVGGIAVCAAYHVGALIERRRHYVREFELRRELQASNRQLAKASDPLGRAFTSEARRSHQSAVDFARPQRTTSPASTDHGFTSGFAAGSSMGSSCSSSSDNGSSSSDSGCL